MGKVTGVGENIMDDYYKGRFKYQNQNQNQKYIIDPQGEIRSHYSCSILKQKYV